MSSTVSRHCIVHHISSGAPDDFGVSGGGQPELLLVRSNCSVYCITEKLRGSKECPGKTFLNAAAVPAALKGQCMEQSILVPATDGGQVRGPKSDDLGGEETDGMQGVRLRRLTESMNAQFVSRRAVFVEVSRIRTCQLGPHWG